MNEDKPLTLAEAKSTIIISSSVIIIGLFIGLGVPLLCNFLQCVCDPLFMAFGILCAIVDLICLLDGAYAYYQARQSKKNYICP